MNRLILLLFIISLILRATVIGQAASDTKLLLVEVQTGSENSASAEFVELINLGFEPVNLENVGIQYMSAAGGNWQTKSELSGWVQPHGRVLASTEQSQTDGAPMSSGLAKTGGHIRIFNTVSEVEYDRLGWGVAAEPLVSSSLAPEPNEVLKRLNDEDGYFQNTGDNGTDWVISLSPTPHNDKPFVPKDSGSPGGNNAPNKQDTDSGQVKNQTSNANSPKVTINELMPDPDSPLTDANDEFVELFNANGFEVKLDGYSLKTGSNLRSSQSLDGMSIKAGSYLTLLSRDTNISLSNSGGEVQILGPSEQVLSGAEYPEAETGLSWSLVKGKWGWAKPTPNAANQDLDVEANAELAAVSDVDAGAYDSPTDGSEAGGQRNIFEAPPEAEIEPINYSILASVGGLAIIYVLYEYRHDIGNRIAQLKRYLGHRKENRRQSGGGRDNRAIQRYRRWQDSIRSWFSRWNKLS